MAGVEVVNKEFWGKKKVLITGHTGFKGSWLALWLTEMGADVTGYALQPPTKHNLFEAANVASGLESVIGDVRDYANLESVIRKAMPDIVFHLAAQPLVLESYKEPVETYSTNVMGTVNLLEAIRQSSSVKAVINVTTDKCYENREWIWSYRENEPLGGYDPYSSSKACSELVTAAYRSSYFNPNMFGKHGVAIATARAGNVIGGGDWANDRLVPDCMRALLSGRVVKVRNPQSIRPWQHVLEPLGGYLLLAERMFKEGGSYSESWNFGPLDQDAKPVEWIAKTICEIWGASASYVFEQTEQNYEAHYLKLDCSKASNRLKWHPNWRLREALNKVVEWTKAYDSGKNMREFSLRQIREYQDKAMGDIV